MWHASIAAHPVRPVARWTLAEQVAAQAALLRELAGVGMDPSMRERGDVSIHARRWLTPAERVLIDPPRDIRGTPEEAERLAAASEALRGRLS